MSEQHPDKELREAAERVQRLRFSSAFPDYEAYNRLLRDAELLAAHALCPATAQQEAVAWEVTNLGQDGAPTSLVYAKEKPTWPYEKEEWVARPLIYADTAPSAAPGVPEAMEAPREDDSDGLDAFSHGVNVGRVEGWNACRATMLAASPSAPREARCICHRCIKENDLRDKEGVLPLSASQMIVCPTCGNKRCPHASDHRLACTGSNEPGQPGSVY